MSEHDGSSVSSADKLTRNITTKFFGGKTIAFKRVRKGPGIDWLGQIIGEVSQAKDRLVLDNEGKEMSSIELIGTFQAVAYRNGEVASAPACYLPNYFAKAVKAAGEASGKPIQFSIEIGVEALPEDQIRGGIAYTWVVKNLIPQTEAEDPLMSLKKKMKLAGVLRLPLHEDTMKQIQTSAETGDAEEETMVDVAKEAVAKAAAKKKAA